MKRSWVISITFFLIAGDVFAARSKGDYNFDKQGIQIGQHLPHLSAHLQNGKSVWLSNYYAERLTLFVCESLTCPVARRKHPGLKEIAKRFGDRIDIVVFYTTEAHPQGDPSPYTEGEEWVTRLNRKQGVLCRQPTTLDERINLAGRLKEAVAIESTMLVDCMNNAGWRALGAGPNVALLVDPKGSVLAKQGWSTPRRWRRPSSVRSSRMTPQNRVNMRNPVMRVGSSRSAIANRNCPRQMRTARLDHQTGRLRGSAAGTKLVVPGEDPEDVKYSQYPLHLSPVAHHR